MKLKYILSAAAIILSYDAHAATVVTPVINLIPTAPSCSIAWVSGTGGSGWSVSIYRVTCPTDTSIVVLNRNGLGTSFPTCAVSAGTAGYSTSGTCQDFTLLKN